RLSLVFPLCLVLFAVSLGRPGAADAGRTDAAVVLTGGKGRIEHGIDVLRHGQAGRMLVAGADPSVTKADIAGRVPGREKLLACCVDLGSESVDTRSNAEEAGRWMAKYHFRS